MYVPPAGRHGTGVLSIVEGVKVVDILNRSVKQQTEGCVDKCENKAHDSREVQSRAEQCRAEQSRAEQSRAEQSRAEKWKGEKRRKEEKSGEKRRKEER